MKWRRNYIKKIPSDKLKIEDMPDLNEDYFEISDFILSFDIKKLDYYYEKANDLNNAGEHSSISELRCHLYIEHRRWNHFGEEIDNVTFLKLKNIYNILKKKVVASCNEQK